MGEILPSPTAVKGGMENVSEALVDWGVPLIALAGGYFAGDWIDLAGKLQSVDKNGTVAGALPIANPYLLLAAGIYCLIGVLLWGMLKGWIGKSVGFAFLGMAVGSAMGAI